jgi:hypothetical protein
VVELVDTISLGEDERHGVLLLVEGIQTASDEALLREIGEALVVVIIANQNVQECKGKRSDMGLAISIS